MLYQVAPFNLKNMEQEIRRWYKKLWETKGARFIAAKRFETHEKWSTITISIVSVYIICLNLSVLVPNRSKLLSTDNITFSTICLSIFVIVISIILSSRNYKVMANKFHDCGREISEIYDKVCIWKNNPDLVIPEDIFELIKEYNLLLQKYDINHSRLDYEMFIRDNIAEYNNIKCPKCFILRINLKYFLDTIFRYLIFILIPLILYLFYFNSSN